MQQEIVGPATESGAPEPHVALRMEIARTGVRQFLIAERIGVSEGQLSRMLAGRKPMTEVQISAISAAIAELAL
jgi:DNA-binding transcriptional regulator YdaS (Cro superfamily)